LPASADPIVSAPSIGDGAAGSAVDQEELLATLGLAEPGEALGAHRQLRRPLEAEVGLRLGVAEVVGDLPPLEQHVQRDDHRARLEDPVVDHREVGQVRARERDLVAGPDAALHQQVGHLVGRRVHLREVEALVAQHDRRALRIVAGAVLEEDGEVEHAVDPLHVHTVAWVSFEHAAAN
jgi:hypothetical protein